MSGAKPWDPDEVVEVPFDAWAKEEIAEVRVKTPSGHEMVFDLRPWTIELDVELEAKGIKPGREAKTPREISEQWKIAGPRVVAGWRGFCLADGTEVPFDGPESALKIVRWRWLLTLLRARAMIFGDGLVSDALGKFEGGRSGTHGSSNLKPVG